MFIDSLADLDDGDQKEKMDINLTFVWEKLESSEPFPCEDMQVVHIRVEELRVSSHIYKTLSMPFWLIVHNF